MTKKTNIRILLLAAAAVLILIMSTLMAIATIEKKQGVYKIYYNKKFIPAMINISHLVPQTDSIVVSHTHSYLNYFIGREIIRIPAGVSSEKSLLYYMVKNNLVYLLVYDNRYFHPLNPLFTGTGLKNLDNDFEQIADYNIDSKLRFQLYRLNNNWTFQQ